MFFYVLCIYRLVVSIPFIFGIYQRSHFKSGGWGWGKPGLNLGSPLWEPSADALRARDRWQKCSTVAISPFH